MFEKLRLIISPCEKSESIASFNMVSNELLEIKNSPLIIFIASSEEMFLKIQLDKLTFDS